MVKEANFKNYWTLILVVSLILMFLIPSARIYAQSETENNVASQNAEFVIDKNIFDTELSYADLSSSNLDTRNEYTSFRITGIGLIAISALVLLNGLRVQQKVVSSKKRTKKSNARMNMKPKNLEIPNSPVVRPEDSNLPDEISESLEPAHSKVIEKPE